MLPFINYIRMFVSGDSDREGLRAETASVSLDCGPATVEGEMEIPLPSSFRLSLSSCF